jgi:hypothetical protein
VRHEDDGRTLPSDPADQFPGDPSRRRVETRCHLIEEHDSRSVHQSEGDEQPLLLPAGEAPKSGVSLLGKAPVGEQIVPGRALRAQRSEQIESLPNLDPVRQGRLLELRAEVLPQLSRMRARVETEHRHLAAVEGAQALDTLDGGGLAGTVGSENAKDLPLFDPKGDVCDGRKISILLLKVLYGEHLGHVISITPRFNHLVVRRHSVSNSTENSTRQISHNPKTK